LESIFKVKKMKKKEKEKKKEKRIKVKFRRTLKSISFLNLPNFGGKRWT